MANRRPVGGSDEIAVGAVFALASVRWHHFARRNARDSSMEETLRFTATAALRCFSPVDRPSRILVLDAHHFPRGNPHGGTTRGERSRYSIVSRRA